MRKAGSKTETGAHGSCDPNTRYRANPDFKLREIAGEFILVPTGEAAVRFNGLAALNQTGRFLWDQLSAGRTKAELSLSLAEEYELTREQSEQDVEDFIGLALSHAMVLQS